MTRKNVPESEQKLLILLALRCLGGVTQLQLLRFMVEEDVMNYFVLQLNLCELEEMGQVRVCHHALGSLYELTEQGRYTLDSFDSHIPASRRQALEAGAARWKAQFRAEQQNQADAIPMKGGRQCLPPAYAGGRQRIAGSVPDGGAACDRRGAAQTLARRGAGGLYHRDPGPQRRVYGKRAHAPVARNSAAAANR